MLLAMLPSDSLTGKVVVVTGGTGALGTAVLRLLEAEGVICHVPLRGGSPPEGWDLRTNNHVFLHPGIDLSDEAAVASFYGRLPELWASIHCAGGFSARPIGQVDQLKIQEELDRNLLSSMLCCRHAVAAIRRTGRGGRLVNVASRVALEPRTGAGMTVYAAAKAAVAAFTVALAQELAREEIWVNAVAPAILDTPANRAAMPEADRSGWVAPEDVAAVIRFLISPANRCVRGAVIPVPGRG
ncbi:MAG: SDR family NAD(P)-dependent oxidoreductase [Acidobacteriota bacterium]